MILYHGTHKSRLPSILENGLIPIQHNAVSLTNRFDVAVGYASMHGGELEFRKAGKKAKHVSMKDRIVVIVDLPENVKYEIRGGGLLPKHEYRIYQQILPSWIVGVVSPIALSQNLL